MNTGISNRTIKYCSFVGSKLGGTLSADMIRTERLKTHNFHRVEVTNKDIDKYEALNNSECAQFNAEYMNNNNVNVIFVDLLCTVFSANIVRYLPENIIRVIWLHSITPGTYSFARVIRPYAHLAVAISPRIYNDLVDKCGYDKNRIVHIPNSLNNCITGYPIRGYNSKRISILVMGRIDNVSKNLGMIKQIVKHLNKVEWTMTIAGDGPDLQSLKHDLKEWESKISIIGRYAPTMATEFAASHDIYLLTSRYEGFSVGMLEAMSVGCVPVASHISGVTDYVVEHGKTGLLFPVGSARKAAEHIKYLALNHDVRQRMSIAAYNDVKDRFDAESNYAKLAVAIRSVVENPPPIAMPLDLLEWSMPKEFSGGIRRYIPRRIKNMLWLIKERMRI